MKKFFQLAAIAVVAMGLAVACKPKTVEEPEIDSTLETIDTTVEAAPVEDTIVAEPVATTPAKKPAATNKKKGAQVTAEESAAPSAEAAQQNASNRMSRQAAKDANVSESNSKTAAPSSEGAQQNAQNRMSRR